MSILGMSIAGIDILVHFLHPEDDDFSNGKGPELVAVHVAVDESGPISD